MGSAKLRVRRAKRERRSFDGRPQGWEVTLFGQVVATVAWGRAGMTGAVGWYWYAGALSAYAMPRRNTVDENVSYSDDEAARRDAFAYVGQHVRPMHVALSGTQAEALWTIAAEGRGEIERRRGGFWTYAAAENHPITGVPSWHTGTATVNRLAKIGLLALRGRVDDLANRPYAGTLTAIGKLRASGMQGTGELESILATRAKQDGTAATPD